MLKSGKWFIALIVLLLAVVPALAQEATPDAAAPTVSLGGNDELGSFFVGPNGMTLYLFTKDTPGVSNCAGDCATNWPPLTVADGENPTLAAGIPGLLGVIAREDGSRQVTYNGWPLYYWAKDMAAGDATGQGVGDVWYIVTPPTVSVAHTADLGDVLVGPNGMTLYLFTNDETDKSNCYDQCATNWPPLTVADGQMPTVQPGLTGTLGTTARDDGTTQVTYDGMPLYYWAKDTAPGDTTGQNVGEVWFVIQPPTLSVGGNDELGDFLVGPNGMTLYLFTNDEANVSNCYDQCAVFWPPLLVGANQEPTAGEGVSGEIGVIDRTDGTRQVTYNGMPLYYWLNDVKPGDATGQNVREVWFVVEP